MRWIRFTAEDHTRYGILEGGRILEVSGSPFDGYEKTSRKHDIAAVKIEVPVIPRTFYCAGLNYVEHVKGSRARMRRALNEHELAPLLDEYGFEVYNLEEMSMAEQIQLFRHGDMVISPHGAGLSNIVYCQPNTKVIELLHDRFDQGMTSYWSLCNLFDLNYTIVMGSVPEGEVGNYPSNSNFAICAQTLRNALEDLID